MPGLRSATIPRVTLRVLDAMLRMEDALRANRVPKPTTIAWPLHYGNFQATAELIANGYVFARGGHNRPYRPDRGSPF